MAKTQNERTREYTARRRARGDAREGLDVPQDLVDGLREYAKRNKIDVSEAFVRALDYQK